MSVAPLPAGARSAPSIAEAARLDGARRDATLLSVTVLGALPPWRAVAPYTAQLVASLEQDVGLRLEFLDFVSLYPRWLYPGNDPLDYKSTRPTFTRTRVRRLLAWYNPLSWLWAGLTLRGQVVHAQWWSHVLAPVYAVVLSLARLRRRRVVLTLHNVDPHEGGRWQRWLYRSIFRFADHFIVHSAANAEALASVYPRAAGRTSVVPLGLHRVCERGLTGSEARGELGLPSDARVLLAFGNIRPYKGLEVLLGALRRLVDRGEEATLVIAGELWGGFERYQRLIDELDLGAHVRSWPEYVAEDRVEAFFRAADIAVYPYTHFDAQSAAATLALSFGVPLVVSNVGGLPDLASDPRAVVPPNDPAALAEALRLALTDDAVREKLASDSRRKAKELDWGEIARRTAGVYRRVLCQDIDRQESNGHGIAA